MTSVINPIKLGYCHDPPRLVLCYTKGGSTRKRTMPVRGTSSGQSMRQVVDQLISRHSPYLSCVPKAQIQKLVSRLLGECSIERTGASMTSAGQASGTKTVTATKSQPSQKANTSTPTATTAKTANRPTTGAKNYGLEELSFSSEESSVSIASDEGARTPTLSAQQEPGVGVDSDNHFALSDPLHTPSQKKSSWEDNILGTSDSDSNPDAVPPKKPARVEFDSDRNEVITFSRDSSRDALTLSTLDAAVNADDSSSDGSAGMSPTLPSPAELKTASAATPLTSTPKKAAISPLGDLPTLGGLSPFPSLAPTDEPKTDAKRSKAKGKAKGKAKNTGGQKKKKTAKGKKNDLLALLDDQSDSEEDVASRVKTTAETGKRDTAKSKVGKRTPATTAAIPAQASSGKESPEQQPSEADQADTNALSKLLEKKPFLQAMKEKHQQPSAVTPGLSSSSSDSETDSTGRYRPPATAATGVTGVKATPAASGYLDSKPAPKPVSVSDSSSSIDYDLLPAKDAGNDLVGDESASDSGTTTPQHGAVHDALIDPDEDLNKADDCVLASKKKQMEQGFQANCLKPGDVGYEYDIEVDFDNDGGPECGWDESGASSEGW